MTIGFKPVYAINNSIAAALTVIERARGFLEAASLSEEWIRRMGEQALVWEAHHTTHIEGTRLTLEQSERIWAGKKVKGADPDDAWELLNFRKAFDFVAEYVVERGPITEGLIRESHKRLVEGVRGDAAAPGEYRRIQNYVVDSRTAEVIYTPPPAHDIPILMGELVYWLNRRAGYDFKRLFTLSEYYDRNRDEFYRSLQSVRERGMDMTGWLEYYVEG